MATRTNNNKTYYINPAYLTFNENSGYGANLIQVSASSSCWISVYDKANGIGYSDADKNYQRWKVTAYNNKFPDNDYDAYRIYVRLERNGTSALIVYSKRVYNVDGSSADTEASADYYYIYIGDVSATDGTSIRSITYDTGYLESDQGYEDANELNEMWELDKYSTPWLLRAKQWLHSFTVKGFISLVGGLIFKTENEEKVITDIKRSTDNDNEVPVSDESLPTTKYINNIIEDLDDRFLRKDQDDRTEHSLGVGGDLEVGGQSSIEGSLTVGGNLASENFVQGNTMGSGWSVYRDANGNFVVETDRMIVRKDMTVNELVVNQETYNKGSIIYVKAGCTITRVEEYENFYRCYYDNQGRARYSGFVVGDQARCQRYDQSYKDLVKYYWRLVIGVGDDFVDLSKVRTEYEGSGVPEEGDDIAQLGNRTDKTRQSAIVISPDNGGSVVVWAGIDSFELSDRNMVGMGVNSETGRAYLYGYGDMYFGDRNASSYMKYSQAEGLEVRGSLSVGSTLPDGRDVGDFVGNVDRMDEDLSSVKEMTDRDYTIWFFEHVPTLENEPAVDWTTEEEKALHDQDMFYYRSQGKAWRFEEGNWKDITDQDTLRALELIAQTRNELSNFDYLKEAMKDYTTKIEGGLLMTSLVAVQNDAADVEAFLNGSDFAKDDTHGKLLLAGGIPEGSENIEDRAKNATTRIFEDGHVVLGSADVHGLITAKSMNLGLVDGGDSENPTDLTTSSGFRLDGYYRLPLLRSNAFTELIGLWISPTTRVPRLCSILCNDGLIEVLYYNGTIYNGVSQINISHQGGFIKASLMGHQYSEWGGQCWSLNIEKSEDVDVEIISHA